MQGGECQVWNSRSQNVALCVQTFGTTDNKTGKLKRRIKLIYPANYSFMDLEDFNQSNWQHTSETEFCRLWQQAVNKEPQFTVSQFYLLTGILLPIWDLIDEDGQNVKVWRVITTDTKDNLLGRVVTPVKMHQLYSKFNKQLEQTAADLVETVNSSNEYPPIAKTWRLKKSTVNGSPRYEVIGWQHSQIDMLTHYGCFTENINHRCRVFIAPNKIVQVLEQLKTAV